MFSAKTKIKKRIHLSSSTYRNCRLTPFVFFSPASLRFPSDNAVPACSWHHRHQVLESVGKAKFGMRRYGDPSVPVNVEMLRPDRGWLELSRGNTGGWKPPNLRKR